MQYMVVGPDGKEYGPASVDTLKQWATENRLQPSTQLRDFGTGQLIRASALAEIFPSQSVATMTPPPGVGPSAPAGGQWAEPPNPSNYVRPMPSGFVGGDSGSGDVWFAIIRSILALVFFFALGGIGLFIAGYGLYYAIRGKSKGHRLGTVAVVISAVTLVIIGIGWAIRLSMVGAGP